MQSNHLPQFTESTKTVSLTFRERFINPILHPVTIPFEPWIKTRVEVTSERAFYYMGTKIITHPGNYVFLKQKFENL